MAAVPSLYGGPSWGRCSPGGGAGWIELASGEILVFGRRDAFPPSMPPAACEILDAATLRRALKGGADQPWETEQLRRVWSHIHPTPLQSKTVEGMADDLTGLDMTFAGLGPMRAYKFRPMSMSTAVSLGNEKPTEVAPLESPDDPRDVAAMTFVQRFAASMPHALEAAWPALKQEFAALLEPEALAILAVTVGALVTVSLTGVGAGALFVIGWALFGWAVFDLARNLWGFFKALANAENEGDLKEAGRLFAELAAAFSIDMLTQAIFGVAATHARKAGAAVKAAREAESGGGVRQQESLAQSSSNDVDNVKLNRQLDKIYAKAQSAKAEIDALADEIARKYGGRVAKAPLKSRERALEKIVNDYEGDASLIKDIARNTIIVDKADIDKVVADLTAQGAKVKVVSPESNAFGYSGINSKLRTSSGLTGEIQVNTPDMIFAKEPSSIARSILGDTTYDAMIDKYGDIGGKGHQLYEDARKIVGDSDAKSKIERFSVEYYNAFR